MKEENRMASNEEKERENQVSQQSPDAMERLERQREMRENFFGEVTRRMVEAVALREGYHVLDIAAGEGDQSLIAARNVGPTGAVLAIDISAEVLKVATLVAEQEGFTNITTQVMNAEQLDLADETFDAVICRFGLSLLDYHKVLSESLRVLKPGRRLAAVDASTPDRHPFISMPLAIAAKYGVTTPVSPNPFSLGKSGVFEQALKEVGFHDISVQAVPLQLHIASKDTFLQVHPVMQMIKQLNQQDQQRVREEIKQALNQFEGPQDLTFPMEVLLGVGKR